MAPLRLPRRLLLLTAVVAVCLVPAASSEAAIVTVGSPLTATFGSSSAPCTGAICTVTAASLGEPGARVASPVAGTVIRWHVLKASGGFKLRVLRPTVASTYFADGTSAVGTPSDGGLQTFATSLPIRAGDLIGVEATSTSAGLGFGVAFGSEGIVLKPPPADGTSAVKNSFYGNQEFAFNAEVQPTPTLASLSPAAGSTAGGTAVTIAGTDFEGATAVRFGAVPASVFHVDSEGQISATAPAAGPGPVKVTVVTPGGSVTSAASFTYATPLQPAGATCKVPNLSGRKLRASKKRSRGAHCKVGKVIKRGDATAKTGRVVKQVPKAGLTGAAGTKIRVVLE